MGGAGITTIDMKRQKTFEEEGWDFKDIWRRDGEKSYPYLISEKESHSFKGKNTP